MQTRLNPDFTLKMVVDIDPGNWFRAGCNELFFRTEQRTGEGEYVCVSAYGKFKNFKGSDTVLATKGRWVEEGAEENSP